MRELTSCPSCNRYIATDFSYCPYCGTRRAKNYEFRKLLDEPFDAMETRVQEYSLERLESIGERLAMLEVDLDAFLNNSAPGR